MEPWQIAVLVGVTFVGAFIHAVSGFGFALVSVPPLAFLVGPVEAVVLTTLLGAVSNLRIFAGTWRDTDWAVCRPLVIGALAGMPFGLLVLLVADARVLTAAMAIVVLASTLLIARGRHLRAHGTGLTGAIGALSGILNTSTSMNGPPVVLYLQGVRMEPARFRGTLSAFFTASSAIALVLLGAGGTIRAETVWLAAFGLPALLAGYAAGARAFRRIEAARFRQLVIGILLVSALVSLAGVLAQGR
jgi:uncharacterized membrane protein YfcA